MAKPWSQLPATLQHDVPLLARASAKLRQDAVDVVFYLSGGIERLHAFVERDDENYKFFLQHLWAKGLPRVSSADVSVDAEGVETLLARLDAGEHAQVVSPDGFVPVLDQEPAEVA